MKNCLVLHIFSLFVIFSSSALCLQKSNVCILCHQVHAPRMHEDALDLSNSVFVRLEFNALDLLAHIFPCLAQEITERKNASYLAPRIAASTSIARVSPYPYPIVKEQVLSLCFLATINSRNEKIPLTYEDVDFFREKIQWQEHTKKWLGWHALALFFFFSAGGALANFFNFINIYSSPPPESINETNSSIIDTMASLAVQDILLALGTGFFSFMGNAASLVWTGLNQDALRDMATRLHKMTHRIHDDYMDLSRTLILLSYYYPNLAQKIAEDLDAHILVERILNSVGEELSTEIIGPQNLLGAAEFVKSKGQQLPKNYELQAFILSLEK